MVWTHGAAQERLLQRLEREAQQQAELQRLAAEAREMERREAERLQLEVRPLANG